MSNTQLGDPVVERQREDEARGQAIEDLLFCINSYSDAAQSQDARYDHICSGDKEKVNCFTCPELERAPCFSKMIAPMIELRIEPKTIFFSHG